MPAARADTASFKGAVSINTNAKGKGIANRQNSQANQVRRKPAQPLASQVNSIANHHTDSNSMRMNSCERPKT